MSKNNSNHHNQNKNSNNNFNKKTHNQSPNTNTSCDKKEVSSNLHEIEKLNQTIKSLELIISNLKQENTNLKQEISSLNSGYVEKIKEKTLEAQKIIDETKLQLNQRLIDEVNLKTTQYVEKKFNVLLDCINQLNTIVNTNVNLEPQVQNYLMGFKMIASMFNNALVDMGINLIVINIGDKFDESTMHSFELVDNSMVESGCVAQIISDGYTFNGKIIKHAVVKLQK